MGDPRLRAVSPNRFTCLLGSPSFALKTDVPNMLIGLTEVF
jgi:hypothetical protein